MKGSSNISEANTSQGSSFLGGRIDECSEYAMLVHAFDSFATNGRMTLHLVQRGEAAQEMRAYYGQPCGMITRRAHTFLRPMSFVRTASRQQALLCPFSNAES
eukprot:5673788-Pleurochrysis_carterae.AAC.2